MNQLSAAETRARPDTDAEQPVDSGHVLDRAVDILESFVRIGPELGVSELSRALGLNKATAHRLLTTLKRRDLVSQDPVTRRYRLGMKLWELGSRATADFSWIDRVHPYLERLTAEMGETTHMAILEGSEILYVDKVETSRSLRMPSQVGRRLPAHCTALGKAMLAYLTDDVLDWVISRQSLVRATAKTITDPVRLRTELELIRKQRYAVDNEELEEGLRCIAAPIRDHLGRVIAAVSSAGPTARLRLEDVPQDAALVMKAAGDISIALGCPPTVANGQEVAASEASDGSRPPAIAVGASA
jgi:DNA-binding IclR family transcriptional regulator